MKKTIPAFIIAATLLTPAAFAFAQTSTGSTTPSTPPVSTKIDYSCVQTAVDAREGAIGDAFTTFSSAESAALSARKSALHDAWGQTTSSARRDARNKAWSDFKTANRAAFTALRSAKKAAWSTFATASKACHAPVVESAASEGTGSLGL